MNPQRRSHHESRNGDAECNLLQCTSCTGQRWTGNILAAIPEPSPLAPNNDSGDDMISHVNNHAEAHVAGYQGALRDEESFGKRPGDLHLGNDWHKS